MKFEKCTLSEAKKQLAFFIFFRSTLQKNDIYYQFVSDSINEIILHNPRLKEIDILKLQIKVKEGIIEDAKFKTFGCGSAIASSSLITEWVKGKTLNEAAEIKNTHIAKELALPPVKIHCSVLAEDAIKAAIKDYETKCECKNV